MSMFCYQCQETAMGTGCTLKGVCGKTSEVANLQVLGTAFSVQSDERLQRTSA